MPEPAVSCPAPEIPETPRPAPGQRGRVLVVDDEPAIRQGLEALLSFEGYAVDCAANGGEAVQAAEAQLFDAVLLDVSLPDADGLKVLRQLRQLAPALPVIMISAYGTIETAVAAMQAGARTFLQKPWANDKLIADLDAAIAGSRLEQENRQLKRALRQRYSFPHIVGKSEPMLRIFDLVEQIAPSRSTILLQGESGVGKELIAKAIHTASPRAEAPFVPVNSGSMPVDLLESMLFGHVRGAFTGAVAPKKGLFEVANRGTIFLDEIGNMSLETQAKLLRVLQDRRFMRLGGVEEIQVDVRVIAATHRDLQQLTQEGRFREDLYYRLNVITLRLPPLRERREDVPLLASAFLGRFAEENHRPMPRLAPEALRLLIDYDWPGNVRELENAMERALVLSSGTVIEAELLPEPVQGRYANIRDATLGNARRDTSLFAIVEDFERRLILDMLEQTHGRQTEAAERFQVPLSTLNQKIKRLGIDIKKLRDPAASEDAAGCGAEDK